MAPNRGTGRSRTLTPAAVVRRLLLATALGALGVQLLQPTEAAAQAPDGEQLSQQLGCVACHSTDGSERTGPTWQGLAGEEVTLDDGSTVTADEAYIRQSILEPDAQVVEGYAPGIMSATVPPGSVSPEEADALVAYIMELGGGGGGEQPATPEPTPTPTVADTPSAGTTPPGPPAIYYAGWGLLALGGLFVLLTLLAYLRFLPNFTKR